MFLLAGIALATSFLSSAWAEMVVVVSSDNPNSHLTQTELSDIFLGRRNRFPNGELAVPVNQRESSDAFSVFYSRYLNLTPSQVRAHWSRLIFSGRGQPPRTVPDGSAMAEMIANNPRGIGYLEMNMVDARLQVVRVD